MTNRDEFNERIDRLNPVRDVQDEIELEDRAPSSGQRGEQGWGETVRTFLGDVLYEFRWPILFLVFGGLVVGSIAVTLGISLQAAFIITLVVVVVFGLFVFSQL